MPYMDSFDYYNKEVDRDKDKGIDMDKDRDN